MGGGRGSSFSGREAALGALFLLGVAAAAALLGILGTREIRANGFSPHCPNISPAERIDCAPELSPATKAVCELRGCCWSPGAEPGVPWCFFGTDHGYSVQSGPRETEQGLELSLVPLPAPPLFGAPLGSVRLRAQTLSPTGLRLQFTDPVNPRFQVPEEVVGPFPSSAAPEPKFLLKFQKNPFGVQVLRAGSGRVVFDTSIGPLLYSDQFLQVSAHLSCSALYGRGQGRLRLQPGWHRWGLYSSQDGQGGQNFAGVHPFLLCLEDTSGASLGVFLLNSNAMELSVSPAPAVTFRSIGGTLELLLLLGDSPEQLLQEHSQLLGLPALPPYWALGFQLSHSGYGSLEEAKNVLERNRAAGLPHDALVLGTEAMDGHRDFTVDPGKFRNLPEFRDSLGAAGRKLLLVLDAAIGAGPLSDGSPYGTFQRGTQAGVWVNESDGVTPLIGQARPGRAQFPDFSSAPCRRWWEQELQRFHRSVPFDGLSLDLDGATSFVPGSERGCADNKWNFPPYSPAGADRPLFRRSLCPDAAHAWGRHYDVHNLYGHAMAAATHRALQRVSPSQRPLLVSGSTFAGSGRFGGQWGGAGPASWAGLRDVIPALLRAAMAGIPYSGGSICGGIGRCPEQLCRRWHQLGAFLPLARNHNQEPGTAQDPAAFGARSLLLNSTRAHLGTRYRLLPHLYTLSYLASARGHSVARALPFEFFAEEAAWDVDTQFLWGAALLITPVLEPDVEVIRAYIPDAVWYEFDSGSRLWLRGQWTHLYLPGHRLGLHLRGGHIVPVQDPATTTASSRRNPLGLIVALDENQEASGELFWDDGESAGTIESKSYIFYEFRFSNNVLELSVTHNNYSDPHWLEFRQLRVLGLPRAPISISVTSDGVAASSNHSLSYDGATQVAEVQGLRLKLGQSHVLRWSLGTRESDRFDCHPWDGASRDSCLSLGCVWNETTSAERVPYCHYAGPENGYGASDIRYSDTGATAAVTLRRPAHQRQSPAHLRQSPAHQSQSPAHSRQSSTHSSMSDAYRSTTPIDGDNTGSAHSSTGSAHQIQSPAHLRQSPAHQSQSSTHSSTSDTYRSAALIDGDNTGSAHSSPGSAHQRQSPAHLRQSPAHQSQSSAHSSTSDAYRSAAPIDSENTGSAHSSTGSAYQIQSSAHQSQSSTHESQSSTHSSTRDTYRSAAPIDSENTGSAHSSTGSAHQRQSPAHLSQSPAHQSQSSAHCSTSDTYSSTGSAHCDNTGSAHYHTDSTHSSTGSSHQSGSSAHSTSSSTYNSKGSAHSHSGSTHPRGMEPIERLRLEVTYHSDHLLQFKISDPSSRRYEVPVPLALPATPLATPLSRLYDVEIQDWPFGIRVRRRSSGTVIWDSQLPTFTFADRFLQISTHLPAPFVYGFGENEHGTFRHDLGWHTWGMFARDQPPGYKLNSYGFQPFYMALEEDGNAHGVLLLNSNAMDVTLQPTPALTFRSTGGILDFYLVLGPSPEQVVQEYTQLIGRPVLPPYWSLGFQLCCYGYKNELIGRPVLPPYWSLGFQLCRYGYRDDAEIAQLVQEMSRAQIPLDVQYADIDYMERQLDFTLSPRFQNLPQLVRHIRSRGMRFVLILDPAISANETNYPPYERGLQQDVFIKWPNSDEIIFAKVWPDLPNVVVNDSLDWDTQVELYRAFAAVPDFFRNSTRDWWAREISEVFQNPQNSSLSIKFDGIWIDMNEPSSFVHGAVGGCRDRDLNFPPYVPQLASRWEGLSSKTLCMEGEQWLPDGTPVRHYDVHNLYGWAQTEPTLRVLQNLTGERGLVVTRSTFPGSGRWAGHWLGDNTAAWDQMGKSIVGMLDFSLFGVSYTGADICGFFGEPSFELCARWTELGAFYPYSRNHNGNRGKRQDPVAWNSTFASLSRDVLRLRYRLLPVLYSLLFRAHSRGDTVVRPLLHQFVEDRTTWDLDRQFLWGEGLLVSPVLEPGAREVRAYLPDARWFDFHTDEEVGFRREFRNFPAPLGHINLHIRGGLVLPQQLPANNTWFSRRNPLLLTVALNDSQEASGSLFWDDGVGIDTYEKGEYLLMSFTARSNLLELRVLHDGYEDPNSLKFTEIKILGFSGSVGEVTVTRDSAPFPCSPAIEHDPQKKVLKITQLELELGRNYTVKWG